MPEPTHCPACSLDFRYQGDDGKTYLRVIGLYSLAQDRTVDWQCPACLHQWERHFGEAPDA